MHKIDGDPAATGDQVPDAPARPMMEENAASNRRYQHLPPEVAGVLRHLAIKNNSDETSEELHAEKELQGEPGPPEQKSASSKIKPTIPADNDDSSLADTWGDYNFAQAEKDSSANLPDPRFWFRGPWSHRILVFCVDSGVKDICPLSDD